MATKAQEPVVRFGKHKGQPWSKVPDSYLDWIIGNFDEDDPSRDLAIAEIRRRDDQGLPAVKQPQGKKPQAKQKKRSRKGGDGSVIRGGPPLRWWEHPETGQTHQLPQMWTPSLDEECPF